MMNEYTKSVFLPDIDEDPDDRLKITRTALPFCPGSGLSQVTRENLSGFVVLTSYDLKDHPVFLTARSNAIRTYLINPKKLKIKDNTVVQYLRFFCRFVQADQGAFPIIERARDLDWRFETEDVKKAVDTHLFPVKAFRELQLEELRSCDVPNIRALATQSKYDDEEGRVHSLAACVSFGRSLSLAWFLIFPDGDVGMAQDWSLVPELPVYPQMLTHRENFAFEENRRPIPIGN